ncbi:MAG: DUF2188 domain-containing protein [Bacilli bacterium]|nr:DUF2188 domain-containing protein [Bacilli bacterium]
MRKLKKINQIFFLITTLLVLAVATLFAICLTKVLPTQKDLLSLFLYIVFKGDLITQITVFGLATATFVTFIFLLIFVIKNHQMKHKWWALIIYFLFAVLLLMVNSYFVNPIANTTTLEKTSAILAYVVSIIMTISELIMIRAVISNDRATKGNNKKAIKAKAKLLKAKNRDNALVKEAAADSGSLLEWRYQRALKHANRKQAKKQKQLAKLEERSMIAKAKARLEQEINTQKEKEKAAEQRAKSLAIARKKALEKKAEAQRKAAIVKQEKEKNKALLESKHRAQVKKFAKEKKEKIQVRKAKIDKLDEDRKLASELRRIEAERQRLLKARAKRAKEIKVWDVYHLMPHPTEGWQLKKMNEVKPIKTFARENDALKYGIKFSKKRDDIKVFLHDKSGKFKRYI